MKPSIEIFGIIFTEPMTMITDYMITILACFLGVRLLTAPSSKNQSSHRAWGLGFIFIAVGALFGGSYHGLGALLSHNLLSALWKVTLYTIGFSVFFMLAGTIKGSIPKLKWRQPFYVYNFMVLLAYSAVMINNDAFIFVILDYVPALVLIFILQAWSLVRNRSGSAKWLMSGVVVSFIAAGVQASGFDLHFYFNHNDLYHVIQMVGLYLFFKGAKELSDNGGVQEHGNTEAQEH